MLFQRSFKAHKFTPAQYYRCCPSQKTHCKVWHALVQWIPRLTLSCKLCRLYKLQQLLSFNVGVSSVISPHMNAKCPPGEGTCSKIEVHGPLLRHCGQAALTAVGNYHTFTVGFVFTGRNGGASRLFPTTKNGRESRNTKVQIHLRRTHRFSSICLDPGLPNAHCIFHRLLSEWLRSSAWKASLLSAKYQRNRSSYYMIIK